MRSPRCGRLACGPVYVSRLPGTTRERSGDLAGCVNKLTDRPVCMGYTVGMRTQLSDDAWASLAKSLDVEEAALKAVAAVEAAGTGFLRGEPPRPKILFEAHAFHRLTGGRFAAQAPNLSHPTWDRSRYSGSPAGEWKRLEAACNLDRPAALQAAHPAGAPVAAPGAASPPPSAPFTRPVCPYPQMPAYRGTGDTADAASFECKAPTDEQPRRRLLRGGR